MPLTAEERECILGSLTAVGRLKPIGYLPRCAIFNLLELSEDTLISEAALRGLVAISLGPTACCIKGGALYIYDRDALGKLLSAAAETLSACNMAIEPDEFVRQVAATWFDKSHPAYHYSCVYG